MHVCRSAKDRDRYIEREGGVKKTMEEKQEGLRRILFVEYSFKQNRFI